MRTIDNTWHQLILCYNVQNFPIKQTIGFYVVNSMTDGIVLFSQIRVSEVWISIWAFVIFVTTIIIYIFIPLPNRELDNNLADSWNFFWYRSVLQMCTTCPLKCGRSRLHCALSDMQRRPLFWILQRLFFWPKITHLLIKLWPGSVSLKYGHIVFSNFHFSGTIIAIQK